MSVEKCKSTQVISNDVFVAQVMFHRLRNPICFHRGYPAQEGYTLKLNFEVSFELLTLINYSNPIMRALILLYWTAMNKGVCISFRYFLL